MRVFHCAIHDKGKYFSWKTIKTKMVSFHLFGGLGNVISLIIIGKNHFQSI